MNLRALFPALTMTLLAVVIAGCQSAATLSIAVRSGDTVIVGLSGEAEALVTNTTAEVIRPEDLTAQITDAAGATAGVRVRSVFRVYGDPTATPLAANQGQWIAVIDLVDGNTQVLDLEAGPAVLRITSGKLISDLEVDTTILAGTGAPHPLLGAENSFDKLGYLVPARQALVSVSGDLGDTTLGAVQYEFAVDQEPLDTPFGALSAIDSIKLQGRRDIAYQSWVSADPEGGTRLTVVMTAPTGVGQNELRNLDIALVAGALSRADDPATYFSGSLQQAVFYDLDGTEIGGLEVSVGLVE